MQGPKSVIVEDGPSPFKPADASPGDVQIQPSGFLLELSPDWLIVRASENIHQFLGQYHVRLIGEPLASFTLSQPLHDLRNTLSRLGGSSGIARAYRVRLIDEPRYFDIAFQLSGGRILLEGVPSPEEGVGTAIGSVGRLIEGGIAGDRKALLEGAARRMRALTGSDRVTITVTTGSGEETAESSRGNFAPSERPQAPAELPPLVCRTSAEPVCLFPRMPQDRAPDRAILRSPTPEQLADLQEQGIQSALTVPLMRDGNVIGYFECDYRKHCEPDLEMHAAAELFAQIFAMQLRISELAS